MPRRAPASTPVAPVPADARQRLLDAAADLFLSRGFAATAFDQVRLAAGVSNGSLYHHFSGKAELARALYLHALADYQHTVAQALRHQPVAADGVRALVRQHLSWIEQHPREARVLHHLRDAAASDGQGPDWSTVNAPAFDALRAWIEREVEARRMHAMPFDLWLALVIAPLIQLGETWLRQPVMRIPPGVSTLLADAAVRAVTVTATAAAVDGPLPQDTRTHGARRP